MPDRGRRRFFAAVLLVTLSVGGAAFVAAGVDSASDPERIDIRIHYSRFEPSTISVPLGRPVTIVLRNEDPIDHEWIVGDDAVHVVHRTGTEAHHASRPTEVSIPALSTRATTITFDRPAEWQFICHLPGHEAYGMVGTVHLQ
jgi:uncharacterized cupredoxin-like copper-binding protein